MYVIYSLLIKIFLNTKSEYLDVMQKKQTNKKLSWGETHKYNLISLSIDYWLVNYTVGAKGHCFEEEE